MLSLATNTQGYVSHQAKVKTGAEETSEETAFLNRKLPLFSHFSPTLKDNDEKQFSKSFAFLHFTI